MRAARRAADRLALDDRPYHRIQAVSNDTVTDQGPWTPRGRATTFGPISGVSGGYGATLAVLAILAKFTAFARSTASRSSPQVVTVTTGAKISSWPSLD